MSNLRASPPTLIIVGLLLVALLLTAGLTWEAVRAERARQAEVQNAVRGQVSVIGEEFARRTVFELEALASPALRGAIFNYYKRHDTLPPLDWLRQKSEVRQLAMLIGDVFLVDFTEHTVTPPIAEPLQTWLRTELPEIATNDRERRLTVRATLADGDHVVIYGVGLLDQGKIFGLTLPDPALGAIAARSLARRSVFPDVVGGGRLTNRDVFIRLTRRGREVFRSGTRFDGDWGMTMPLSDSYGQAIGGLVMEISVAPSAVPALVLGGIPQSRVPLLLAILFSTTAVLAGVLFLLRREHHLARTRSDFITGVSHELRTPLTQIRMFAETLLFDRTRSDDERARSLRIINEEARRLTNLVDNVLFLSRPARAAGDATRCDVETATSDAIDAFMPLAMRRDVVITSDLEPGALALIDAEAWQQIVTNILDNAVKYGPEGQTVRVTVSTDSAVVRLAVDDEGPGVPPAERERIWQRFHRLERDRGTHKTGSGIGLAIVRSIVRSHRGRCEVGDAPGGARFIVEIPAARSTST